MRNFIYIIIIANSKNKAQSKSLNCPISVKVIQLNSAVSLLYFFSHENWVTTNMATMPATTRALTPTYIYSDTVHPHCGPTAYLTPALTSRTNL